MSTKLNHLQPTEIDIESRLVPIIDRICSSSDNFEELDFAIKDLENKIFALDEFDSKMLDSFYDNVPVHTKEILNDKYCEWETILENRFAEALLNSSATGPEEYLLYKRFQSLISKELKLLEGNDFQNLLFIGSGPFPITAILLNKISGKPIDCLERDEESAKVSRKILQNLGLADQINVYLGDGGRYDLSKYDVILNALLAKPKWGIMNNIKKVCASKTRVLCRTSYGLRQLLYESTSSNAIHGFSINKRQLAGYNETISTLLLANKKGILDQLEVVMLSKIDHQLRSKMAVIMNAIVQTSNGNGFLRKVKEEDVFFSILERDLELGLKHLLIVRKGEDLLGLMLLNLSHIDTYHHRADISTLMIHESIRGEEVSLKVVTTLLQKCDELGVEYLTLDVRAESKVFLLWKYLGFETYGRLPCYSRVNNENFEGLFMFKDVQSLKKSLVRKFKSLYNSTLFNCNGGVENCEHQCRNGCRELANGK